MTTADWSPTIGGEGELSTVGGSVMVHIPAARGGVWLDVGDGSWIYLELNGSSRPSTDLHIVTKGPNVRVPNRTKEEEPDVIPDEGTEWVPTIPTRVLGFTTPASIELTGRHEFDATGLAKLKGVLPKGARLAGVVQVDVDQVTAPVVVDAEVLVNAVVNRAPAQEVVVQRLLGLSESWGIGTGEVEVDG